MAAAIFSEFDLLVLRIDACSEEQILEEDCQG